MLDDVENDNFVEWSATRHVGSRQRSRLDAKAASAAAVHRRLAHVDPFDVEVNRSFAQKISIGAAYLKQLAACSAHFDQLLYDGTKLATENRCATHIIGVSIGASSIEVVLRINVFYCAVVIYLRNAQAAQTASANRVPIAVKYENKRAEFPADRTSLGENLWRLLRRCHLVQIP